VVRGICARAEAVFDFGSLGRGVVADGGLNAAISSLGTESTDLVGFHFIMNSFGVSLVEFVLYCFLKVYSFRSTGLFTFIQEAGLRLHLSLHE
jgi:hypothetical protein